MSGILIVAVSGLQTYLFEGIISRNYLRKLAGMEENIPRNFERFPAIKRLLRTSLYLGGPLHGFNYAMPIVQGTRFFLKKMHIKQLVPHHDLIGYSAGGVVFLCSTLGNHFSEVVEARKTLSVEEQEGEGLTESSDSNSQSSSWYSFFSCCPQGRRQSYEEIEDAPTSQSGLTQAR